MKYSILLLILTLNQLLGFSQTKPEIDSLLDKITHEVDNSKKIILNENAKTILIYGEKNLELLPQYFIDSTQTKIYSECQERNLTKGELAIILSDRIEIMPYAQLTGIQNCILTFCTNNPNLIEYYFSWNERRTIEVFQKKYLEWYSSKERITWAKMLKGK